MRRQQSVNNHYDCPGEVTECTFLQTWLTLGSSRDKAPANTSWEQRRRRSGNILLSCERLHRIILPFPEHVQLAASSYVSHPVAPPLLGGKPLRMESSLVYLSPSQRRAQCLAHSRHADVCRMNKRVCLNPSHVRITETSVSRKERKTLKLRARI